MKRDKKLQNLADQSLSEYNNEEVANELKDIIKLNKQNSTTKSNKRKVVFWSSIATASVAAVIVALIVFIPMPNRPTHDRNFGVDNRVTLNADLESLNNDLHYFELTVYSDAYITKIVDTYYNETLYYNVNITCESGEVLDLIVVTNKDYKHTFNHQYDNTFEIDTYNLSYSESFELLEPDLYYMETYGELVTKNEKLYFTYNGFAFEEHSNFIECVQQIIDVK